MKLVIGIAAVVIACATAWMVWCPCSRVPGAWLVGAEVADRVADWGFVQDAGLCQLELPGTVPHSINLNCMSDAGELFVSCSRCAGKRWSKMALKERRGRVRVGRMIYPVTIAVVEDPASLDRAWRARARKKGGEIEPRPGHWWSFQLASRP